MADLPALQQRTEGRRAQRRQTRLQQGDTNESTSDVVTPVPTGDDMSPPSSTAASVSGNIVPIATTTNSIPTRRRPRPDIESRIDAAIQARTIQHRHYQDTHPEENDIEESLSTRVQSTRPNEDDDEILGNYEYLDHTADVQLHSWGVTLEHALDQLVVAMFGYMTKLPLVEISDSQSEQIASNVQVQAHDVQSLTFVFLQEWLSLFHETGFIAKHVDIQHLDTKCWSIQSSGKGEIFDTSKHSQGTEVKAVTYSNLQVTTEKDGNGQEVRWDIYVIVDI